MTSHDPVCTVKPAEALEAADCWRCKLIAQARADERARTLDDVAASVRAYFRQHGWEASDHALIEWLDDTITERKDTP